MQAPSQKIIILATGGTLAGTASDPSDNVGYTAAQLGIAQLLAGIPALQGIPIESEQVAQVDSKDMSHGLWSALASRCALWLAQADVAGLVITHGTDTIEETGYFLASVLDACKPVVLTCAMRPATALGADGPRNIVDAVTAASAPGASGVTVVCAGVVHDARHVAKVHHYRLDPFSSGDAGPVGFVEEGQVRLAKPWPGTTGARSVPAAGAPWPRVEIVMSHAGAGRGVIDALRAEGVDGIVVAATGNGTVHEAMLPALMDARADGVQVIRASRTAFGGVIPHAADVLPSTMLSPVKARIALMLDLLK